MDTSFFGELALTLIRDITNKQNLIWTFSDSETKITYLNLFNQIIDKKVTVLGIVVDGRPYFFDMFVGIPIQMCHFHMGKILAKYLTRNPTLQINKELWEIWFNRHKHREETFIRALEIWHYNHVTELNEVYIDRFGRRQYVKIKTRLAYYSLIRHSPWLFTYQKSKWIPTTNNSVEGTFSHIQNKVNAHSGLNITRKTKLIHHLLIGES